MSYTHVLTRGADKALTTMKDKVRDITKRTGGQSIAHVCKNGWGNICVVGRNTSGSPTRLASLATWTNGFAVAFVLST
jgi:Tfp pilus assembly pilus retraction ATPase PilT